MNKDQVKGAMDDAAGRAKRQIGEWTGDTGTQVDGAAQQVKGKVEKVVGNVRESARDMDRGNDSTLRDRDRDNPAFDTDRP